MPFKFGCVSQRTFWRNHSFDDVFRLQVLFDVNQIIYDFSTEHKLYVH